MRRAIAFCLLATVGAAPVIAAPPVSEIRSAITKYCEPLVGGSAAEQVGKVAAADGFKSREVSGRTFVKDNLLLDISLSPTTCSVLPLQPMTFQEGAELADAWAADQVGARKLGILTGPDGLPARGWMAPARNISLIAVERRSESGENVTAFILSAVRTIPVGTEILNKSTADARGK